MPAKYSPAKVFDAKLVYDTWIRLVQDEELYEAMLENRHHDVAQRRGMGSEEILILDDFAVQPGTRWHVDNLRFRCTTMVSRILKWHLPATIALLTGGNENWLRDLTYEYMSDQRWRDLGHHRRLAECKRFAGVVRTKLFKRRLDVAYLDEVLRFELAVLDLLQDTGPLAAERWPKRDAAAAGRPAPSPAVRLLELSCDIVAWLAKPEGKPTPASTTATHVLVWVPAPGEAHRMAAIDASEKALFEACRGDKTIQQLASGSTEVESKLRRWLADGVITV
jgi:hypothetical protein